MNDMLDKRYDFTAPRGQIGGWLNQAGDYRIGEGNHRMQAAFGAFNQTDDPSYIQNLLNNGVWSKVINFGGPTYPLPPVK